MKKSTPRPRPILCLGIVTSAALLAPPLALAETPPATVSSLPVEPCLASASLSVGNPLPCPASPNSQQPGAQSASAGGAAGASGPAGPGASASVQANTTNAKVKAKVKKRARRHAAHRRKHARRHHARRHH